MPATRQGKNEEEGNISRCKHTMHHVRSSMKLQNLKVKNDFRFVISTTKLPRTNNLVVFATKVEGMPSKSGNAHT